MSNKPKYFATYHGWSYSSHDRDHVMGVSSLKQARELFFAFYEGAITYNEYRQNADGYYVPWSRGSYVYTPATSREDFMDLFVVYENTVPGTYGMGQEIAYRLTWGERDGIKVE